MPQSNNQKTDSTVHSYVLLDRTGSMSRIWDEALGSVNAYADALVKSAENNQATDEKITVAVFDAQGGMDFDVLRKGVALPDWRALTSDEASPRGMTPLFDAIARIISMAEQDKPDSAVIVIMTDGHENASREVTLAGVKAALDRVKARGWEVVFLGANFGDFSDAEAIGQATNKTMAMSSGHMSASMETLAKKSRSFYSKKSKDVSFSDDDRQQAGEDKLRK